MTAFDARSALIVSWVFRWLASGSAAQTLLLLLGPAEPWSASRSAWITALNVVYLLASTSWLLYLVYAAICWPLVVATTIVQFATVSSFTRGRLRSWLKLVHFYRDKVAFFRLPSIVIDTGPAGMVTIRGFTFGFLDLSIELHGIEIGLDLGSGHELAIHCNEVIIKLFRDIAIDEVYGVHWYRDDKLGSEAGGHRAESLTNYEDKTDLTDIQSEAIEEKVSAVGADSSVVREQDLAKDPVTSRVHEEGVPVIKARPPSQADIEAEKRYDDVLLRLRQSNQLYQSRSRVRMAQGSSDYQMENTSETRAAICADLRDTHPPMSPPSGRIAVSRLQSMFEPLTCRLRRFPSVLRTALCILSQSHKVSCPYISLSISGDYLSEELASKLFQHLAVDDKRIAELKTKVTEWLSSANLCLDFSRVRGHASVPLRATNDIEAELRSDDVAVIRTSPQDGKQADGEAGDDAGRIAQLTGLDGSFVIPTCLLPFHAYLSAPPECSEDEDTIPVAMAIRGKLPAHFSESFLEFAATLSKASQMLDIEEEAGMAADDTDHITPRSDRGETQHEHGSAGKGSEDDGKDEVHGFRANLSRGRIGAALKHPIQHGKQMLHKEVKKTAVDTVDGAWFAKWTNKLLKQLEWLDGDVGYSMKIPTRIMR